MLYGIKTKISWAKRWLIPKRKRSSLTCVGMTVPRLIFGAALAAIWPALTTPAIFVAGEEAPMKAAITSYPGRPGVRGESGLAAAAKALGALWLG